MSDCTHDCNSCSENCSEKKPNVENFKVEQNKHSKIKKVIGIVSGKGGVGKSLVTSSLAVLLTKKGYKTAILDADITGPSIPKAFGIEKRAVGNDDGIFPAISQNGTKIMSLNLLLEDEKDPVIWRGSMISNTVKQFWSDVIWGDIDFMFVDMPPGTGDVPLTVFQSLPIDGIIIVSSPQELVSMIVTKAIKMAQMMNIPIIGIVENMSYALCPDCGKKIEVFGKSHINDVCFENHIPLLAQSPFDSKIAAACDRGTIELEQLQYFIDASIVVENLLK
ncbi:MAG: Mrp/NBP35 family ATP-binding protein [Oscillospiraceae bacterium]